MPLRGSSRGRDPSRSVFSGDPTARRSTPVLRARALLDRHGVDELTVVHADGRQLGKLDRRTVELAVAHGYGKLRVADLLVRSALSQAARPAGSPRIEDLGPDANRLLRRIGSIAAGKNARAFLVGGVVRDLILRRPAEDLDVAVEGDAIGVARELAAAGGGSLREHGRFLTATCILPGGRKIDFARTRDERYSSPAALPQVEPSILDSDLRRRDFTINAMAIDLGTRGYGTLHDPCGGVADLCHRRIRVLHGLSFLEDPTRIFRALRFAARLGFDVEPDTLRTARVALREHVIDRLSSTRLMNEIRALLAEPGAADAVRLAAGLRLWRRVEPAWRPRGDDLRQVRAVASVSDWYAKLATGEEAERWEISLLVLSRGIGREGRAKLVRRLRPGRRVARLLDSAAEQAARAQRRLGASRARLAPARVVRACRDASSEALLLVLAGCRDANLRAAIRRYLREWRHVRPEIVARDLLDAGVPPGPGIRRGLDAALYAKLDRRATDRVSQLRIGLLAAKREARRA